ncbi:MAG TPA: protein kinase [Bryobacteraceae bacterium]|nr:protein kinase [Bryobacteraceae bacterium]
MIDTAVSISQTLAQRMAQGRMPVQDALRYSMILAESLRKIHESGHVHGAVSPVCVALTRAGLELMPALGSAGEITPYTAPEVIGGRAADSRSDIFSFGAIVYEMLTGHAAFQGDTAEALSAAITGSAPAPSGSPAVDRLVASCLAKDPATRLQRVQKLILELKLLAVAVRRSEASARHDTVNSELRAQLEQIEMRLGARMERMEQSVGSLLERLVGIDAALKAGAERGDAVTERVAHIEHGMEAAGERFAALDQRLLEGEAVQQRVVVIEQTLESVGDRFESFDHRVTHVEQALQTVGDYIERLEHGVEALRQDQTALRQNVSEDLRMFEQALKHQAAAVESSRTAMSQTDDLVERVVEALESLQSVVLEHSDERAVGVS